MSVCVCFGSFFFFFGGGGGGVVVGRCKRRCLYLSVIGTCESWCFFPLAETTIYKDQSKALGDKMTFRIIYIYIYIIFLVPRGKRRSELVISIIKCGLHLIVLFLEVGRRHLGILYNNKCQNKILALNSWDEALWSGIACFTEPWLFGETGQGTYLSGVFFFFFVFFLHF